MALSTDSRESGYLHHPNLINDQWSSKKAYHQHSDLTTSPSSSPAACWNDRSNQLKDQTVVSLTLLLPFRQIEPDLGWGDRWIPPNCTIYICVHYTFVFITPFHTKQISSLQKGQGISKEYNCCTHSQPLLWLIRSQNHGSRMKKWYYENAANSLARSLSETFCQMVPTRKN